MGMPVSVYVIATRKYRKDGVRYRTRYYVECRDGRPRFVAKEKAMRFNATDVGTIADQLRALRPRDSFTVMAADSKPSRAIGAHAAPSPQPKQVDAFHVDND